MLKVTVLFGRDVVSTHKFQEGQSPICIGRDMSQHIAINDPSVSRLHARLIWQPDGTYAIEDAGSSNRLVLGGRVVDRAPISEGLELGVGKYSLVFSTRARPDEGPQPPGPAEGSAVFDVMQARSDSQRATAYMGPEVVAKLQAIAQEKRQAYIQELRGRVGGKIVRLTKDRTTLGKSSLSDVRLVGFLVGAHAATIVRQDDDFVIQREKGLRKLFVNGNRVPQMQLQDGDIIRVGPNEFKFHHEMRVL